MCSLKNEVFGSLVELIFLLTTQSVTLGTRECLPQHGLLASFSLPQAKGEQSGGRAAAQATSRLRLPTSTTQSATFTPIRAQPAISTHRQDTSERSTCSEAVLWLHRLFICSVLKTIKCAPLTLGNLGSRQSYKQRKRWRRGRKDPPETVHLAIGMNFMVANNSQNDLES